MGEYIPCCTAPVLHWGLLPETRLASRIILIEQNIKKWTGPSLCVLCGVDQRLCIHRPAALSALCLSWLGRIWNLGEGVRCVQSRPASAVDSALQLIAVQNLLRWLACYKHNEPPSLKYQYSLSISSLGLTSLWCWQSAEAIFTYSSRTKFVNCTDVQERVRQGKGERGQQEGCVPPPVPTPNPAWQVTVRLWTFRGQSSRTVGEYCLCAFSVRGGLYRGYAPPIIHIAVPAVA